MATEWVNNSYQTNTKINQHKYFINNKRWHEFERNDYFSHGLFKSVNLLPPAEASNQGQRSPALSSWLDCFCIFFSFCFFFFCTSGRNIRFSAPRTLNLLDQGLLLSTDRWDIPVNLWRFTFSGCFPPTSPAAGWFCPRVESNICSLGANQCPGGWLRTGWLDGSAVGDQVRKAPVEVASEALNLLLTIWVSWLFSALQTVSASRAVSASGWRKEREILVLNGEMCCTPRWNLLNAKLLATLATTDYRCCF